MVQRLQKWAKNNLLMPCWLKFYSWQNLKTVETAWNIVISWIAIFAECASYEQKHKAFPGDSELAHLQANVAKKTKNPQPIQELLAEYVQSSEELAPVNAIVGGILANEALKCISKKGQPIDNVFCYSMLDGSGVIEKLATEVWK